MSTTTEIPAAEPELITLQDLFVRFAISKSTWYRLVKAGGAPPIVKLRSRTLVPLAAARAWMQARVVPAATLSRSARGAA